MRLPKYLSYSSMVLWEGNPEEWFVKYAADARPDRVPQEKPASVGSAFDACVKSNLYFDLFGTADPKYTYEALFEAQVEPHNRDWVKPEGEYVFQCYRDAGLYDDLLAQMKLSPEPPRFEFTVNETIEGVPVQCKPDARFLSALGVHIIHDWKVNGYCSKSATSPCKGYFMCRPEGKVHKQFKPFLHHDLTVDAGYMEDCNTDWADQLTLYGWSLGEKIGDQNVALSVHQTVGKPIPNNRPLLRFSEYRARVRDSYQELLIKRLKRCWEHITSGHILHNMTREQNDNRLRLLNDEAAALISDGTPEGDFFSQCVRPRFRG